jgi:ribosomal protein L23
VNKYFTQKTMLLMVGVLVVLKFGVLPLWAWQSEQLGQLQAKYRQFSKLTTVINGQASYGGQAQQLTAEIARLNDYFYVDSSATKLTIQQDIEKIFAEYAIRVEGFSWLVDDQQTLRSLRATVRYSGDYHSMMKALWALANQSKVVRQVDWRQGLTAVMGIKAYAAKGTISLEFFARAGAPVSLVQASLPSQKGSADE